MRFWQIPSKVKASHHALRLARHSFVFALASILLIFSASLEVLAQKHFKKTYPARSNVRLQLKNWSGTIRIEVWQRDAIEVRSMMDGKMQLAPQSSDGAFLDINVQQDNMNKGEMGFANFEIRVPVNATVDVETREGNIVVRGVQGDLVRAHISTRGEIELTEINARQVFASTRGGDIFFAGDMRPQGMYKFVATEGDVHLRLPQSVQFSLLTARAPITRDINLGNFANAFNRSDNGRVAVGSTSRNGATCDVMSMRGSIFILR